MWVAGGSDRMTGQCDVVDALVFECFQGLSGLCPQVDRNLVDVERARVGLCGNEQVVDDVGEICCLSNERFGEFGTLLCRKGAGLILEDLAESEDRREGSAELMADAGQKVVFGSYRLFEAFPRNLPFPESTDHGGGGGEQGQIFSVPFPLGGLVGKPDQPCPLPLGEDGNVQFGLDGVWVFRVEVMLGAFEFFGEEDERFSLLEVAPGRRHALPRNEIPVVLVDVVPVGLRLLDFCLLYTSPSPRDRTRSR